MKTEFIFEGLKSAISRGSTLEQAVISFKNAGYPESEINIAVAELHKKSFYPKKPSPKIPTPISKQPQKTSSTSNSKQQISSYGIKKPKKPKLLKILILVFALLIIVGMTTTLLIFKSSLF